MEGRDFYELLGVSRSASQEEIKRAYRRLARQLHPDANQGDPEAEEKFKEVTLAYEVLSDPEARRRYDMFGLEGVRGTGATGGGGSFFGGGINDIFEAFFGSGSPFGGGFTRSASRRGPRRGPDAEVSMTLAFEEAVFGAKKEVKVSLAETCEACTGTGAKPGTTPATCTGCGGTGEVRRVRQSVFGQMVTATPCTSCGGTGEVIPSPCGQCRGEGRVTSQRTFAVEVPPGVDSGATLRLAGRGPAGFRGGPNGDLYVRLTVADHPVFQRQGYDLVRVLDLPMTQAALGGKVRIDTLDGEETVVVPPGTQTGRIFRLRGLCVPHLEGRGRGDLVVTVRVLTPEDLSPEEEELLHKLAAIRGEEIEPVDAPTLRSRIRSAFR
jgi:molecular chaperone DnaJ